MLGARAIFLLYMVSLLHTGACNWLIFSFKKTLKTVDKSAAAVVLSMYKYTCGFAAYAKKLYGGVP